MSKFVGGEAGEEQWQVEIGRKRKTTVSVIPVRRKKFECVLGYKCPTANFSVRWPILPRNGGFPALTFYLDLGDSSKCLINS
jgi:hypothetical protein